MDTTLRGSAQRMKVFQGSAEDLPEARKLELPSVNELLANKAKKQARESLLL